MRTRLKRTYSCGSCSKTFVGYDFPPKGMVFWQSWEWPNIRRSALYCREHHPLARLFADTVLNKEEAP
jgi:hypothetical protein